MDLADGSEADVVGLHADAGDAQRRQRPPGASWGAHCDAMPTVPLAHDRTGQPPAGGAAFG